MKCIVINNCKNIFQDSYEDSKIKKMAICIKCQGIGYIKHTIGYKKCSLCEGSIYINKSKVASILGKN